MRGHLARVAGLAVLVLVPLAACGGDDPPGAESPGQAVDDFGQAMTDHDAGRACALVTGEFAQLAAMWDEEGGDCKVALEKAWASRAAEAEMEDDDRTWPQMVAKDVTIDGDRAEVVTENAESNLDGTGEDGTFIVVRIDGRWFISRTD